MFYHAKSNQYIQEGTPFSIDGIQYPQNWLNLSTPEQKIELGLEEVVVTNFPKNDQYYWVSQELNGATLTYTNNPKDLDQIKQTAISKIEQIAYTMLLPSDWMVTRFMENGTEIPLEWKIWRESIRKTATDTIALYEAATTVDEIADLQVSWDSDPKSNTR